MSFRFRSGSEVNTPRAITSRSILANHNSTWLSQDEYVGVKCMCTFGWSARNAATALVLCAERLSAMTWIRSEEHTSELQSLMRISYAVFCLTQKKKMKHIKLTSKNNPVVACDALIHNHIN